MPGSSPRGGMLGYLDVEDALGRRITFQGPTSPGRRITNAVGLPGLGLAGARAQRRNRPGGHGSINRSRLLKEKLLTIEGVVSGSTPEAAQTELGQLSAVLFDCLEVDRLARYRIGLTGLELQCSVRWDESDLQVDVQPGGRAIRYQAHLVLSDPRGYAQAPLGSQSAPMSDTGGGSTFPMTFPATFTAGAAGICAFDTTQSTVPTPPTFRIVGMVQDPVIQLDDDHRIVLAGTVARGDVLTVQAGPGKPVILLNDQFNRMAMRDFAQTRWFDLPQGVTGTVRLLAAAADPDAYMTLSYSPAVG